MVTLDQAPQLTWLRAYYPGLGPLVQRQTAPLSSFGQDLQSPGGSRGASPHAPCLEVGVAQLVEVGWTEKVQRPINGDRLSESVR